MIRRSGWAAETTEGKPLHEVVAGPLRICLETHTAPLDDKPLVLTVSEFDLLVALVRNKGRARENLRTVLPPGGGTKALDGWRRSGAGNRAPLRRSMRGRGFSGFVHAARAPGDLARSSGSGLTRPTEIMGGTNT